MWLQDFFIQFSIVWSRRKEKYDIRYNKKINVLNAVNCWNYSKFSINVSCAQTHYLNDLENLNLHTLITQNSKHVASRMILIEQKAKKFYCESYRLERHLCLFCRSVHTWKRKHALLFYLHFFRISGIGSVDCGSKAVTGLTPSIHRYIRRYVE